MSTLSEIRDTIIDIAHQNAGQRTNFHLATVVSVNESMEFCTVSAYDAEWTDVRLTAVFDDSNYHIVPKVGSYVMVADLSNGAMCDLAVFLFSQVERIEVGTAEHTAANADVLAEQLAKLTTRVDNIYNAIKNAKPSAEDGGANLQSTMVALLGNPQKEDWSNIQDNNIKHGSK